jgi:hypothetical protein
MDHRVGGSEHYKKISEECPEYEPIRIIEAYDLNFALGNVIKYTLRSLESSVPNRDLKKAMQYLEYELAKRENREPRGLDVTTIITSENSKASISDSSKNTYVPPEDLRHPIRTPRDEIA